LASWRRFIFVIDLLGQPQMAGDHAIFS